MLDANYSASVHLKHANLSTFVAVETNQNAAVHVYFSRKDQDDLARSLLGLGSAEMTAIYNHTTLQKDLDKLTRTEGSVIDQVWRDVLGV